MTLTYHPVRLFRLACGCLREYPMMPAGVSHTVLCPACRASVQTTVAYPERCCGTRGWAKAADGRRLAVSCTLGPGQCTGLLHIDTIACLGFTAAAPRLSRGRTGRTGRA